MKIKIAHLLLAIVLVTAAVACGEKPDMQWNTPPAMQIETDKDYTAILALESGDVKIKLHAAEAPNMVNNFVFLAQEGFYDGVTFHRVIPNFMAQTGDPTGTGRGDPGYKIDNEFHPNLRHDGPGVVAMANSGARGGQGTNGSQFYITFSAQPHLDGLNPDGSPKDCTRESCHPVFGQVVSGMEHIDAITARDPGAAVQGDVINTISIIEE